MAPEKTPAAPSTNRRPAREADLSPAPNRGRAGQFASRPAARRGRLRTPAFVEYDWTLLGIVAVLVGLGLVMVFSASYVQANQYLDSSTYFLMRQLRWLALGVAALVVAALFDYRKLQALSVPMMVFTVMLLVTVLILGNERLGATRFLGRNGSIQPSELAKLTITIYIAYWLTSKGDRLRNVSYGLAPFAILLGLVAGLIILQPDFDTTTIIVVTALAMFFVAGADIKQLVLSLVVSVLTLYFAIIRTGYSSQRISDYLAGLDDPLKGSDQVWQSVLALARGGVFGAGLGDAMAKQIGGVPLPWSDSIFAVVGEELGLVGTVLVVALFMALVYRAARIARRSEDRFGLVLGTGLTAWLGFQAFVNMAVVAAMLPYSGQTLPFVSYGGSSLVACMAAIGLLLSISHYGTRHTTSVERRVAATPVQTGFSIEQEARRAIGGFRRWHRWPRLPYPGSARRMRRARPDKPVTASVSSFNVKASSVKRSATLSRRIARTKRTIARRTGAARRAPTSGASSRRIPRRR